MKATPTFLIVFAACASVAAPASEQASSATVMAVDFDCLDIQGQRELLAGIELEIGPQAAQLARCNARVSGAERYAAEQEQRAKSAELRTVIVGASAGTAAVVATIVAIVEVLAHPPVTK